jgi:LAO/AO transport system kinase
MQNKNFRKKKSKRSSPQELIDGILKGDKISLSKAITLCESSRTEDRAQANEVLKACLPASGKAIRVGISGVPGVGKSTFIESFGSFLINEQARKVAVLAVDPSSEKSKGSILGDKTRMEQLSRANDAYIRPTATGGALGGVTHSSKESIILCEAAGFDVILIETVGVGQSETEVRQMCDFFLLLMLAGAGDELQGIKRGIMEMADGLVINKADGDNLHSTKQAQRNYQNALHLFPPNANQWTPKVESCSALEDRNMDGVWEMITAHQDLLKKNGFWERQREEQERKWFAKSIRALIELRLFADKSNEERYKEIEKEVIQGKLPAYEAAEKLLPHLLKSL